MKEIRKRRKAFKLHQLPEIVNASFKWGNIQGCTGSIFKRPLSGLKGKIYWHYAFFYGFTIHNELLMIENNIDGAEGVYWNDFLDGADKWEITHIEKDIQRFDDIMHRAKSKAKVRYVPGENNCEHYVNFSVFGKHESVQAENTKLFTDVIFSIAEARIMLIPGDLGFELIDSLGELRKHLGVKRKDELQKIIDGRKKV